MKVTRVIQYEGEAMDVQRALTRALLTIQRVVHSGENVPYVGLIHAAPGAPKITIRLLEERTEP